LGTCKHVLHVLRKAKRKFKPSTLRRPFNPTTLALHLDYLGAVTLRLQTPANVEDRVARIIRPLCDGPIEDIPDLVRRLASLQKLDVPVTIYPDAEEFIEQRMASARLQKLTDEIRKDPSRHPLRTSLLHVPLLPYQLDGIAFAAGVGRAILADDMGLGKTIQGIGTAELLARQCDIRKVLVVCPASLKSQWRSEIHRFCDRSVQLIGGRAAERVSEYRNEVFYTVCNYEQVLRDITAIEQIPWDLIILDEGQRIKNWESKTSQTIKGLRSRFVLVLTGTPLENRLDDLFSIAQFVDDRRLGPGFRFFNTHRILDEKGKVLGYKNLASLRETLKPFLLRRTRESVALELPARTSEIVRIAPSDEQLAMHQGHMQIVAAITRKPFISEMDLLRLKKELLMCRMVADSTFLVDKDPPGYSTKLERLEELLEQLFAEKDRKVVLFSEWTTMLDLIQPLLTKRSLEFVRLDGKVPQKKRQELIHRFQKDPSCRLFLTTNAGSTGLNLQAANTVINVDLPWNPAVLEQRIARAHRMGQKRPIDVYILMTEGTIEESLLATLAAKKDLALAALDVESDVDLVKLASGIEDLKSRLEILLGAVPEAPADQSQQRKEQDTSRRFGDEHQERVAKATGDLIGAACRFFGELVGGTQGQQVPPEVVQRLQQGIHACINKDANGTPRLNIPLPNPDVINQFVQAFARLTSPP
jgi:SNF2 family DNA or RNA helicase